MSRLGRGRGRAAGPPAPFVVGVGRSGTTLLRLMLDAHPKLTIPAETHFVPELIELAAAGAGADALAERIVAARGWRDFGLDPDELRGRVAALERPGAAAVLRAFYELCAATASKPRWGDKTPGYVKSMRAIGAELPEARFVHLIRDGRDVALSRRARGMGTAKPIGETARLWRRRIESAREQARKLRRRYLELRFEDLVADPERALRRVCELVELEFDPAMLAHHEGDAASRIAQLGDLPPEGERPDRSGEERRASHALAAAPPNDARVGAWRERMGPGERAEFEAVAGELLRELGYDVPS